MEGVQDRVASSDRGSRAAVGLAALADHQAELERDVLELQGWLAEAQADAAAAKTEAARLRAALRRPTDKSAKKL